MSKSSILNPQSLISNLYSLYFAYRDPRVPWYARVWIALLVAYAFSPIDLIPDFIPILGYLDDLVLLPLGVYLALKMIPAPVMEESRAKSEAFLSKNGGKPQYKFMSAIIIAIWISLILIAVPAVYLAVGGIRRRPDDDFSPYVDDRFVDAGSTRGDREAEPPGGQTA